METLRRMGSEVAKTTDSVISLPIDLAKAGVETLAGENPLPKARKNVRDALTSVLLLPLNILKAGVTGAVKDTGRLLWGVAKNAPILPSLSLRQQERNGVLSGTRDRLERLKLETSYQSAA